MSKESSRLSLRALEVAGLLRLYFDAIAKAEREKQPHEDIMRLKARYWELSNEAKYLARRARRGSPTKLKAAK